MLNLRGSGLFDWQQALLQFSKPTECPTTQFNFYTNYSELVQTPQVKGLSSVRLPSPQTSISSAWSPCYPHFCATWLEIWEFLQSPSGLFARKLTKYRRTLTYVSSFLIKDSELPNGRGVLGQCMGWGGVQSFHGFLCVSHPPQHFDVFSDPEAAWILFMVF